MLYAFPSDRTGCGFYRVIWPLGELRDRVPHRVIYPGDDAPLLADIDRKTDTLGYIMPKVKGVTVPDDCSAVLLQRPCSVLLVQCIPFLQARGIKVIVEVDDDLHSLTPRHASYKSFNPPPNPLVPEPLENSLAALMHACELADLVICSTPALVDRYASGPGPLPGSSKGVVLRNRLRSDFRSCLKKENVGEGGGLPHDSPRVSPLLGVLQVPELPLPVTRSDELEQDLLAALSQPVDTEDDPDENELRVGWAGVITTHPDDLQVLSRALPRAGIDKFHILGPHPRYQDEGGIARAKRLLGIDSVHFTGSVTFADFLPRLAQAFDIAVAPLEDNRFNKSKSWLKPLEYAACGIPTVRSTTFEYSLLGVGYPAANDYRSWLKALKNVLSSQHLRDELVGIGYEKADANTYALHADEWYEALAPLVEGSS